MFIYLEIVKNDKEIEHIKDILIKFMKETPLTNKNNELLLMTVNLISVKF